MHCDVLGLAILRHPLEHRYFHLHYPRQHEVDMRNCIIALACRLRLRFLSFFLRRNSIAYWSFQALGWSGNSIAACISGSSPYFCSLCRFQFICKQPLLVQDVLR